MNSRALSVALVVVGVILLVYGINAHDSVASSVKESITGTPTDKSLWLMILGAVGIVLGGLGAFMRRS